MIETGHAIMFILIAWAIGLIMGVYGAHFMRHEEDSKEIKERKKIEDAYWESKMGNKSK